MSDADKKEENNTTEELDVGSECFNPLRALYAADYKVTEKTPKVFYQNIAAFESALHKVGVWQLNKRQQNNDVASTSGTKSKELPTTSSIQQPASTRRFEPHQMAVSTCNTKHKRNIYTHMSSAEGPLAFLLNCLPDSEQVQPMRVRIYLRKQHGIGGTIEGELVAYDRQWNVLLKNAVETWQRRKHKYGEQKIVTNSSTTEECTERLSQLGISLPCSTVKSLNRKNVELRREIPQAMVRGENVVLISCINN